MKISIAADGIEQSNRIAKRFGQADYIQIYDTENKSYKFIKNIKEHSHKDLEGIIAAGVSVFIVGNIGPNSFYTISDYGCEMFLARNKRVDEAVRLYLNNGLQKLREPTVKKSIGHTKNKTNDEHECNHNEHHHNN